MHFVMLAPKAAPLNSMLLQQDYTVCLRMVAQIKHMFFHIVREAFTRAPLMYS